MSDSIAKDYGDTRNGPLVTQLGTLAQGTSQLTDRVSSGNKTDYFTFYLQNDSNFSTRLSWNGSTGANLSLLVYEYNDVNNPHLVLSLDNPNNLSGNSYGDTSTKLSSYLSHGAYQAIVYDSNGLVADYQLRFSNTTSTQTTPPANVNPPVNVNPPTNVNPPANVNPPQDTTDPYQGFMTSFGNGDVTGMENYAIKIAEKAGVNFVKSAVLQPIIKAIADGVYSATTNATIKNLVNPEILSVIQKNAGHIIENAASDLKGIAGNALTSTVKSTIADTIGSGLKLIIDPHIQNEIVKSVADFTAEAIGKAVVDATNPATFVSEFTKDLAIQTGTVVWKDISLVMDIYHQRDASLVSEANNIVTDARILASYFESVASNNGKADAFANIFIKAVSTQDPIAHDTFGLTDNAAAMTKIQVCLAAADYYKAIGNSVFEKGFANKAILYADAADQKQTQKNWVMTSHDYHNHTVDLIGLVLPDSAQWSSWSHL